MSNNTQAVQVQQIIQQLATLPGSMAVDLISKKLPRLGPAEPGTAYQINSRHFDVQNLPESFNVPAGSEEVIIRLHGHLAESQTRDSLVDDLNSLFMEAELHQNWDVRARFKTNGDPKAAYELTVFSHLPAVLPEPLA